MAFGRCRQGTSLCLVGLLMWIDSNEGEQCQRCQKTKGHWTEWLDHLAVISCLQRPSSISVPSCSVWVVKKAALLSCNYRNQCVSTCGAWAQSEPSYLLFLGSKSKAQHVQYHKCLFCYLCFSVLPMLRREGVRCVRVLRTQRGGGGICAADAAGSLGE